MTESNLRAYAPFNLDGRHYEPGDIFEVPAGWKFEEQMAQDGSFQEHKGISFSHEGFSHVDEASSRPAIRKYFEILPLEVV